MAYLNIAKLFFVKVSIYLSTMVLLPIEEVKRSIKDKQVIFGKLHGEVVRMLRVFEKLHSMGKVSLV